MPIKTCIFDAYGTLFDVAAAARNASKEPEYPELAETWPQLAEHWRLKQLQYTWLRAVTGDHTDFWTVTQNGLDWALDKTGLAGNQALRDRLLQLYWELQAYPEVLDTLTKLKAVNQNTAILSNGSVDMLNGAVTSAEIGHVLDDVLSVDSVGIFKPSAKVYDLVQARFGGTREDILFVSSNGWDAAAAAGYGFTTAWVNRAQDPVDRLSARPQHILSDLTGIADLVSAS